MFYRLELNQSQKAIALGRCSVCDKIGEFFNNPKFEFQLDLDWSEEETSCEFHVPMMDWIIEQNQKRLEKEPWVKMNWDVVGGGLTFERRPDTCPTIHTLDYKHRLWYTREVLIRRSPNMPDQQFTTTLDPHWVDLQLASQWMDRCLTEHGTDCHSLGADEAVFPDWLIDTEQEMLVRGQQNHNFVALSYRWGDLTTSNIPKPGDLERLRKPKTLSQSPLWKIPIIRDSIHVVRVIGERYLWIDSLCMNYGDGIHLTHQIQNMGKIYAAAKLVIVATNGDAMEGLRGLRGCSESRDLDTSFTLRDGREAVIRDLPDLSSRFDVHTCEYFRRGWTFQEYFLARRRLIFGKKQIHWSCSCATWHEDLPEMNTHSKTWEVTLSRAAKICNGIPDFEELADVIREYNGRNLTYPEDAFPGIIGLLQALSLPFAGGFLFGIPRMYFESGLLWSCSFNYGILNRKKEMFLQQRKRSTRVHCSLPYSQLPSWSWIAWKGGSLLLNDRYENFVVTGYSNEERFAHRKKWITIPITEWYSHSTPQSDIKQPIKPDMMASALNAEPSIPLPKGWAAECFDHSKHAGPDLWVAVPWGATGKVVYRHSNLPGMYYWRPVLVNDCTDSASVSPVEQNPFISCKTQRGLFYTRVPHRPDWISEIGFDAHIKLLDPCGEVCGWVQLARQSATTKHPWSSARRSSRRRNVNSSSINSHNSNIKIELVAICRRMFPVAKDRLGQTTVFLEYNEYYGVLYVEWKQGVAYRRGVGYVTKDGWEQHDLEDVDLVLG